MTIRPIGLHTPLYFCVSGVFAVFMKGSIIFRGKSGKVMENMVFAG